jgi:membrane-associated protease RseP (regulator of RpoE activity)
MSSDHDPFDAPARPPGWQDSVEIVLATAVPEPPPPETRPAVFRRQWKVPLLLFLATCLSTFLAGGWTFALCLMAILVCHEAGHYFQARRYGVLATYPYFLPMPFSPIGTLGAVIAMDRRIRNRKALFDIGITGPLAGLAPTIVFCVVGLSWSQPATEREILSAPPAEVYGSPVLFDALATKLVPALPADAEVRVKMHPMAFAGWVGLLVTALNLIPIGQLDGGHVLYALLRRKAHWVAMFLLVAAMAAIVLSGYYWWTLMVVLLTLMGPKHPPTADDHAPLGPGRAVLGWLTLAFLLLGFTPNPFPRLS